MKRKKLPLFVKVLIAIALGVALGWILPDFGIRILKTFNVLFAQLLKFIVPLLVLGLVTPAISALGKDAGKMLLADVGIAYLSTICAGFFAYGCGTALLPNYLEVGELSMDNATKTFSSFLDLKIPPCATL